MNSEKTKQMKQVRDEVVDLRESPLYEYRVQNKYNPVIGQGNHDANIMFIGEAPGLNEAKTGIPFCGASGKILDELLEYIGVKRENIYIANILKDRPPENRDPTSNEIEIYGPFLDKQINIIQPKVIATLGRYSMEYIMRKFDLELKLEPISIAHGKSYSAKTEYGEIKIIPLYHPAVAVYNRNKLVELKEDFKILKKYIV